MLRALPIEHTACWWFDRILHHCLAATRVDKRGRGKNDFWGVLLAGHLAVGKGTEIF